MHKGSEDQLQQQGAVLCETLSAHRLPRWDALPDLELYMDQVVAVMEKLLSIYEQCSAEDTRIITPSIINNYVKLKVVPPPDRKRYSKTHLAYLIMVCILKQTLSISSIAKMMERQLSKKSIDELYNDFCDIYEAVLPLIRLNEPEKTAPVLGKTPFVSSADMDDFVLRAAILSTAGKCVCEGVLSAVIQETEKP